jgi:hypothetical protein
MANQAELEEWARRTMAELQKLLGIPTREQELSSRIEKAERRTRELESANSSLRNSLQIVRSEKAIVDENIKRLAWDNANLRTKIREFEALKKP